MAIAKKEYDKLKSLKLQASTNLQQSENKSKSAWQIINNQKNEKTSQIEIKLYNMKT